MKTFNIDRANKVISIDRKKAQMNGNYFIMVDHVYQLVRKEEELERKINNRDEFIDQILENEE